MDLGGWREGPMYDPSNHNDNPPTLNFHTLYDFARGALHKVVLEGSYSVKLIIRPFTMLPNLMC